MVEEREMSVIEQEGRRYLKDNFETYHPEDSLASNFSYFLKSRDSDKVKALDISLTNDGFVSVSYKCFIPEGVSRFLTEADAAYLSIEILKLSKDSAPEGVSDIKIHYPIVFANGRFQDFHSILVLADYASRASQMMQGCAKTLVDQRASELDEIIEEEAKTWFDG